ncbi:MAG: bifunctional (p)ppGpp synthetase/guanosine-3',5'-bis(diphosphate) 3'-pyrophosphohydrolase, partial [Hamadaea sp.]|uniref:ACT domain-containing protein n=1 Tax=Hamadaea sp. TaxID=2024425 RepID=UPI0018407CB2
IRQYFKKERRDEAIEQGKEQLNRALRREVLPLKRMLTAEVLIAIARELNLPDVASLYAAVGESQVSAQSIVASLVTAYGGEEGSIDDVTEIVVPWRTVRTLDQDPGVVVVGVSDVWIKLARCCTPVPGDDVFGFVTRSGGVSVHRNDCANAEDLQAQPERIVQVTWKPRAGSTYLVSIQVEALTRDGLLADITNALAIEEVKILSAIVSTTRDGVAVSRFSFEISDTKHLGHLFGAIRKVDGVFDVYRVTS